MEYYHVTPQDIYKRYYIISLNDYLVVNKDPANGTHPVTSVYAEITWYITLILCSAHNIII